MKTAIRKIGNSKGIILPQAYLKECFIEDEVNVEVKNNLIIISAANDFKRKGWGEAFKEMAANGDDGLLIPDFFEDEELPE
jgi:antitoxin MazE